MRRTVRRLTLLCIDLALIALATVVALILGDNLEIVPAHVEGLLPYLTITLAIATAVLLGSGLSQSMWRFSVMADYLRVLPCVVAIILGAVALGFLVNRLEGVARTLPLLQGLLMAFLLIGARVVTRIRHAARDKQRHHIARHGLGANAPETILVLGINSITDLFLRSIADFAADRVRIAGIVGRTKRHSGRLLQTYRILGTPEEIGAILKDLDVHGVSVDRIVITTAFTALSPVAQRALIDIERSSEIHLDFFAERIGLIEPSKRPLGLDGSSADATRPTAPPSSGDPSSLSALALEPVMARPYWRLKRIFDPGIAALLIILLAPLIILLSLIVAIDVGFPTVFWQQRPGAHGIPFKLYKFRTMRSAHDRSGTRVPDGQRLSPIGRFLRRARLDELPQLFNILIGEMSFVGPRPLLSADQDPTFASRLLAAPGLTGWAQIKGGRQISPQDKAALDVWYLRHASLWLDLVILAQTLPTIVRGERAEPEAVRQAWDELTDCATQTRRANGLHPYAA
jgi:lipopolysaccharide/colanic/teichoic acid biosynthesis glycosyltransferase